MPDLSMPVDRELQQSRVIDLKGYLRDDGLWDIEGHLVDTKPFSVYHPKYGVRKPAGVPLHLMKIRLTIDDDMVIQDAEAATLAAPFDTCLTPAQLFPKLKGLSLKSGWKKAALELMGGVRGCTHLTEMLGNMATMAYQTLSASRKVIASLDDLDKISEQPFYVDSCYSYRKDGALIRRLFPQFAKDGDSATESKNTTGSDEHK